MQRGLHDYLGRLPALDLIISAAADAGRLRAAGPPTLEPMISRRAMRLHAVAAPLRLSLKC